MNRAIPTVNEMRKSWGLPPEPLIDFSSIKLSALRDVLLERQRQDAKFGEQNLDPMLYLTVLTEEVGEVAKAILDIRFGKDTLAHLREEAVQTAAVALAFVECLDRGKWKAAGGEPVTKAPPAPARRYVSPDVRVRVRAGPLAGKTGTVVRWEDAGENTWRVKPDEGDEIVLANWNLDRIDDEPMEARRPAGLPTGDARTPDGGGLG